MITGVSGVSGKVRPPGRTHSGTWTGPMAGEQRHEEDPGPSPGLAVVHRGEQRPRAQSSIPILQKAGVTLPRIQRCQPGGAEAPAGLLEAGLVLHHSHENLQPRGVSLGSGVVGTLLHWAIPACHPGFRLHPLHPGLAPGVG